MSHRWFARTACYSLRIFGDHVRGHEMPRGVAVRNVIENASTKAVYPRGSSWLQSQYSLQKISEFCPVLTKYRGNKTMACIFVERIVCDLRRFATWKACPSGFECCHFSRQDLLPVNEYSGSNPVYSKPDLRVESRST